ncbi:MAG: 1,4-alpha-glucan branching protein [Chitinophagaceae bacterium]|nr:MAG: 1,4-alpha-glucan branching protein [Chitinophagaceae bacterium]
MSTAFPIVPWGNGTNIYEVNVRQYTKEGSLQAFMQHVPRLADMGVEILWLMPVTPVSVEKRKGSYGSYYAASSYTDIDPLYGNEQDFHALITLVHSLGMKLIIDWVANHTGYDHQWTKKYPEFYRKDSTGNFTGLYGWEDVIDLDYRIPELRAEMIRSMKHWVETYDIDGFRCDMARTVPIDFWVEARGECDALKPLFWLAECEILAYHEAFDVTYGWEALRAFDKYFKGELAMTEVRPLLNNYGLYPVGSEKLLFTSNHDENSDHGTEYEKYGVAAQAMAVLSCTWPGIPLLYSGQELPNKRRLHFFEKDFIDWQPEVELHGFYQLLFGLRKRNKALQESASVIMLDSGNDDSLVYLCRRQQDKVLVMLNLSARPSVIKIDHPAVAGTYLELFSGKEETLQRAYHLELPPGDYRVYHITSGRQA